MTECVAAGTVLSTPGVILAGGLARRMGGGDKPLRLLAGRPLLAHVLERLRPQAAPLAINANGDPARWSAYRLPVLADPVSGHPGPLAGILAALLWGRDLGAARVLTAPGDTPFLPPDLVARLAAVPGAAVAASAGRLHPTVGLWPVTLSDDLAVFLARGGRRVRDWSDRHAAAVAFPGEPFVNINTPADLAAAGARR